MSDRRQFDPDQVKAFNRNVIDEFRANAGAVGGMMTGVPLLLLTTTGARSGEPRVSPLAYTTDGDRLVVIGAKRGAPTHPAWYHNLLANPAALVEVGADRFPVRATEAEDAERDRLWDQMAEQMPNFKTYPRDTPRRIPVVVLARTDRP